MSLFKKLKKAVKKVVGVAAPIVGGAIGGPLGATIGSAVGGAVAGSKGAKKASKAEQAAYGASADQYRNALNVATGYQQPYIDAGSPAINALMRVNQGDYSAFENSPDYLYAKDQALSDVQNSAASRGGLFSGNAGRELAKVSSGYASQNLNNYRNALLSQIGIGQSAANNASNAAFTAAGGVGNSLIGAGDARASGIVGKTNALTGAIDQVGAAVGDYIGSKRKKTKLNALFDTTKPIQVGQRVV